MDEDLLEAATVKVRRACRNGDPDVIAAIREAIQLEAEEEPRPLDEIADEMIAAWQDYSELCAMGEIYRPLALLRFVRDGAWCNKGLWSTKDKAKQ